MLSFIVKNTTEKKLLIPTFYILISLQVRYFPDLYHPTVHHETSISNLYLLVVLFEYNLWQLSFSKNSLLAQNFTRRTLIHQEYDKLKSLYLNTVINAVHLKQYIKLWSDSVVHTNCCCVNLKPRGRACDAKCSSNYLLGNFFLKWYQ